MVDRRASLETVIAEFPEYRDRIANGEHIQIYDGKRLPSAEDKLARFGGVENLRKNLIYAEKQGSVAPYILQACRDGIMVPIEIIRFVNLIIVPHRLDPATLIYVIEYTNRHGGGEAFRRVEGVTYLQNIRNYYRILERPGFETTQEGLRQFANLQNEPSNPLLRSIWGWRPKPI